MTRAPEIDQFAAHLRMLKDRSGRGFDRLGRQSGVSGSSLHRYCCGASVPADYGVLHQFAQVCGASREELRTLHRLWALADASRGHPGAPPSTAGATGASQVTVAAQRGQADDGTSRRGWLRPGIPAVAASVCALLVAAAAWVGHEPGASAGQRLLLSRACASTVSAGQAGECVREVQNLLRGAGAALAVDGKYGPETERLVTAYQLRSGLPGDGSVGATTKSVLYAHRASLRTWTPAQVEAEIRTVFGGQTAAAEKAVELARCQSLLDPLWIVKGPHGARSWGVFQLSDDRLAALGGSPRQALDPAWNVRAAHRLWQRGGGFGDWPLCGHS